MSNVVLPYTFTPNTTIASSQVNANFAALQNAFNTNTRTILSAPTTFYLSPTGSDTVSGLNPSQPAATINYIMGLLQSIYDVQDEAVTIQLANGTYNQSALIRGSLLGVNFMGQLLITGATPGSPNLVTLIGGPCVHANDGAQVSFSNMTLQSSTDDCVLSTNSSVISVGNVIFGAAPAGVHMRSIYGGRIFAQNNYQISGGAAGHAKAVGSGSAIYIEGAHAANMPPPASQPVITLSGTPPFTNEFVHADGAARITCTAQFAGTGATGNRGAATANGVIDTNGNANALTTYFPGTVNPTTANGGQIV